MKTCLLVVSDGRHEYHHRSLASALEYLPRFDQYVFVDDADHTLGFAGAIREGWRQVRTDFVFHLEADFTFRAAVPVEQMVGLLCRQPHLAQVALKRQPVNEEEITAGGIIEAHPDDFTEHRDRETVWTEHRRFFTTNPSVYPATLCSIGWPHVAFSEGFFTHELLRREPATRFAFLGAKHDPPRVHHIGDVRSGTGY